MKVPKTLGEFRVECEYKIVSAPHIVRNLRDEVQMQIFANVIPQAMLDKLRETTASLKKANPPEAGSTKRNNIARYYLGTWRDRQTTPYEIKQTRHPACHQWIEDNKEFFELMGMHFKKHFPDMYKRYKGVADSQDTPTVGV